MKFVNRIATLALVGIGICSAQGQADLAQINAKAQQDLESALERLSETRATIREESVPLSRRINVLKGEVRALRAELDREQRAQDTRTLGLEALEGRVKAIQDENDYLSGLMTQFFQELQTHMTAAEQQANESSIDGIRDVLDGPDNSETAKYEAQVDTVLMGIGRLRDRIGGVIYSGEAVDSEGDLVQGNFIELGPISVFASDSGAEAGIIESHQMAVPNATPLNAQFTRAASDLAANGKGELDIDVTLGSALAIEGAKESVSEHILKGGIWVWPIITFACLAGLLAVYKLFSIYSIKQPSAAQLGDIVRQVREGKKDEAIKSAEALPWEFGPMVKEAVLCSDQEKELVEEVMYEKMLEAQPKVERFLSVIAVTAAVAPLLGLLGTVTGMINTFKMITLFGTGDASSLSGGISEALITTELGLVVAIPSLVAHAMLNRKAQSIMANMEKMSVVFVNGLPSRR